MKTYTDEQISKIRDALIESNNYRSRHFRCKLAEEALAELDRPVVMEPVAWRVAGFSEGRLIAHALYFTIEQARTTASVFASHYPTVKTDPLYKGDKS